MNSLLIILSFFFLVPRRRVLSSRKQHHKTQLNSVDNPHHPLILLLNDLRNLHLDVLD